METLKKTETNVKAQKKEKKRPGGTKTKGKREGG